ncbi:hypothetical protein [Streptomyces sp. NPDC001137]|uniref:hypothetical protein n=1 Tax=Streptomyces sp. NPDC001137 TaxID=3154378 RepID=UPI003326A9B7
MLKFVRILSISGFIGILTFGGVVVHGAGKGTDHTALTVVHASGDDSTAPQSPGDGIGWD